MTLLRVTSTFYSELQSLIAGNCFKFFIYRNSPRTVCSFEHTTPDMSAVWLAGLGVSNAGLNDRMSHTGTSLHQNLTSNGQEGRMESDTIKSRKIRMQDSNFCVSAAQSTLTNVTRAHGGPVNASPNMMKQPLRRKRASLSQ